jgi:hypothetical protein
MTLPQIGEVHHLRNASSKVHSSFYSQPSFQSLFKDVRTVKCFQIILKPVIEAHKIIKVKQKYPMKIEYFGNGTVIFALMDFLFNLM